MEKQDIENTLNDINILYNRKSTISQLLKIINSVPLDKHQMEYEKDKQSMEQLSKTSTNYVHAEQLNDERLLIFYLHASFDEFMPEVGNAQIKHYMVNLLFDPYIKQLFINYFGVNDTEYLSIVDTYTYGKNNGVYIIEGGFTGHAIAFVIDTNNKYIVIVNSGAGVGFHGVDMNNANVCVKLTYSDEKVFNKCINIINKITNKENAYSFYNTVIKSLYYLSNEYNQNTDFTDCKSVKYRTQISGSCTYFSLFYALLYLLESMGKNIGKFVEFEYSISLFVIKNKLPQFIDMFVKNKVLSTVREFAKMKLWLINKTMHGKVKMDEIATILNKFDERINGKYITVETHYNEIKNQFNGTTFNGLVPYKMKLFEADKWIDILNNKNMMFLEKLNAINELFTVTDNYENWIIYDNILDKIIRLDFEFGEMPGTMNDVCMCITMLSYLLKDVLNEKFKCMREYTYVGFNDSNYKMLNFWIVAYSLLEKMADFGGYSMKDGEISYENDYNFFKKNSGLAININDYNAYFKENADIIQKMIRRSIDIDYSEMKKTLKKTHENIADTATKKLIVLMYPGDWNLQHEYNAIHHYNLIAFMVCYTFVVRVGNDRLTNSGSDSLILMNDINDILSFSMGENDISIPLGIAILNKDGQFDVKYFTLLNLLDKIAYDINYCDYLYNINIASIFGAISTYISKDTINKKDVFNHIDFTRKIDYISENIINNLMEQLNINIINFPIENALNSMLLLFCLYYIKQIEIKDNIKKIAMDIINKIQCVKHMDKAYQIGLKILYGIIENNTLDNNNKKLLNEFMGNANYYLYINPSYSLFPHSVDPSANIKSSFGVKNIALIVLLIRNIDIYKQNMLNIEIDVYAVDNEMVYSFKNGSYDGLPLYRDQKHIYTLFRNVKADMIFNGESYSVSMVDYVTHYKLFHVHINDYDIFVKNNVLMINGKKSIIRKNVLDQDEINSIDGNDIIIYLSNDIHCILNINNKK